MFEFVDSLLFKDLAVDKFVVGARLSPGSELALHYKELLLANPEHFYLKTLDIINSVILIFVLSLPLSLALQSFYITTV